MTVTGRIHIDLFSTLDGVSQSPGSPTEDDDGFTFGGWQAPLIDDAVGEQVDVGIQAMDALLLGRRTYDIFASYWPFQLEGPDNGIARKLNAVPKYVASRGTPELTWNDSHQIGANLAAELAALREQFREIHVIGSIDFARTLVAENLFDQLNLWVYPIVLGAGKRLFTDDGFATSLTLLSAEATSPNGAVLLRYGPTGAVPGTGVMA